MDLISKQAAIEAICEDGTQLERQGQYSMTMAERKQRDVDILDALPSVQQWIPCSEGLPKKDGRYQVTRYDYVTNTEFVDILWYEENIWWNRHSTGDYAVTAWMPLPKTWKGKQNEERKE